MEISGTGLPSEDTVSAVGEVVWASAVVCKAILDSTVKEAVWASTIVGKAVLASPVCKPVWAKDHYEP